MSIYKKYAVILFPVLIIAVAGIYFFLGSSDTAEIKKTNQDQPVSSGDILLQGLKERPTNEDIQKNPAAYVDIMLDSDHDGLTDEEEKKIGSDPKKYDTDEDGLSDSAEVLSYYTDPKNPDSDGDGHKDGEGKK